MTSKHTTDVVYSRPAAVKATAIEVLPFDPQPGHLFSEVWRVSGLESQVYSSDNPDGDVLLPSNRTELVYAQVITDALADPETDPAVREALEQAITAHRPAVDAALRRERSKPMTVRRIMRDEAGRIVGLVDGVENLAPEDLAG